MEILNKMHSGLRLFYFIATQAIALGKAVHDAIFNVDWPGVWQALSGCFLGIS